MSARFQRVGVLKGGFSAEREVSLRSGAAVAAGLREAGYAVEEVDVQARRLDLPAGLDAVFVALHGEFGEDGEIQALLRSRGMPYTGSGPEASRASFDKVVTKKPLEAAGVPVPAYGLARAGEARRLPLPLVVKPPRQGSSLGVTRVLRDEEWAGALTVALEFGPEALVEAYIEGAELTVGIVGDEALPVVEIRAPQGLYDYRAKYTAGLTQYLVPAPLAEDRAAVCRDLALRTFRALGCEGFARVDLRMDAQGRCFVLELNNIPGFTETSLLPKAARAAGIPFPALCDRILRLASVH